MYKKIYIITTLILCLVYKISSAESEFNIPITNIHNQKLNYLSSQQVGTEITSSIAELFNDLDKRYLYQEDSILTNLLLAPLRFHTGALISLVQHEVVGHGARGMEFNFPIIGYEFELLTLSGATFFDLDPSKKKISYFKKKKAIVILAGNEAARILGEKIRYNMLKKDSIDPYSSAVYLSSEFHQEEYIQSTVVTLASKAPVDLGNDIVHYIKTINDIYGNDTVTLEQLSQRTALSYLDPFLIYSAYSLITGQSFKPIYLSLTDNLKWIPAFRTVLTPYGYEYHMLNFFKINNKLLRLTLGYGNQYHEEKSTENTYYGELYIPSIFSYDDKIDLGGHIIGWSQPELFFKSYNIPETQIGFLANIYGTYKLNKNLGVKASLGYTTGGYVNGFPTSKGLMVGLSCMLAW